MTAGIFLGGLARGQQQLKDNKFRQMQSDKQESQFEQSLGVQKNAQKMQQAQQIRQRQAEIFEQAETLISQATTPEAKEKALRLATQEAGMTFQSLSILQNGSQASEDEVAQFMSSFRDKLALIPTANEAFQNETQLGIDRKRAEIGAGVAVDPTRVDTKDPEFVQILDARDEAMASGDTERADQLQKFLDKKTTQSSGQNITVNTSEKSILKEGGELRMQELFKLKTDARDAVVSLSAATEAEALLDAGTITGFGANFMLEFGKLLQQGGVTLNEDAIANTEAFVGQRAAEVGRIIKQFGAGTGLSDADREFATKAAAGDIRMTEPSIRRLIRIQEDISRNAIDLYNEDLDSLSQDIRDQLFLKPVEIPIDDDGSEFSAMTDEELEAIANGVE